ncbi:MAG: putative hydrolase [Capsulimonas sp.]|nr:putative hydrolase [Capsulimonas sp.]
MRFRMMSGIRRAGIAGAIGLLLAIGGGAQVKARTAMTGPAIAGLRPVRQFSVRTPDGLKISAQEWGDPKGAEVVLIHGLNGSYLSWARQLQSPALRRLHIVTYDFRGHGLSDKPTQARYYSEGKRWGDELHAVIQAAHLKRPVLAGWSLGGLVISNYLKTYGDKDIAGVDFVDAVIELRSDLLGADHDPQTAMASPDLATHLLGTKNFLRRCFHTQPDEATFEILLGAATKVSPELQRSIFPMAGDTWKSLKSVRVPTLIVQGSDDSLVRSAMAERIHALIPAAKISIYRGAGHAPFFENPIRFNQELSRFVAACQSRSVRQRG